MSTFFKKHWLILVLIVVGFLLYANSFGNRMFWDDDDNILKNQYIKDWQYFPRYFSENLIAGAGLMSNYWRPLLLTVFSLEWKLWGSWPPGYHLVNTFFHTANALLLFFVLFRFFQNRRLAFLTALVFLIHPLQTEAVTYVSGLADPLSVFFILLGLLFYLKFEQSGAPPWENKWFWLSLLSSALALLAKETAIVLPVLIFLAGFSSQKPEERIGERLKASAKKFWPFLALALIYFLLRATTLNFVNTFNLYNETNVFTANFLVRLLTFFRVLVIYFSLLFWPQNLHMERSVVLANSWSSPDVVLGAFLFFGLLALAFFSLLSRPRAILGFGLIWFFIGLAPTSNLLIPVSGLLYEHWLYLPLAGIFLILIWLGFWVSGKYPFSRNFLLILLAIFLAFLARQTFVRNREWRDPITFYNQTLKYAPGSYRVINNLGMAYADKGDPLRAEKTYQLAIQLDPKNPVAWHNLANAYRDTGRADLAIEDFKKAISLDPQFFFSYNALVSLYLEKKDYGQARQVLESYLQYSPAQVETLVLLSRISFEDKDYAAALGYLRRAHDLNPQNALIEGSIADLEKLIESKP
ncbi:MAG: tetratricopeptide repeat protein [Candidatus Nealsonbacteria bacterium]|nr:tetratricopeptide repeat protein [Candidatus Nealsonbacteria bacterium]